MSGRDREEARRRRDEAIARGYDGASNRFRTHLDEAIRYVANNQVEFTSDDIWEWFDENEIPVPSETRALGGALKRAQNSGLVRPTDRVANSDRPICHCRAKRVWEVVGGVR